jgi:outer membrane protein TolC
MNGRGGIVLAAAGLAFCAAAPLAAQHPAERKTPEVLRLTLEEAMARARQHHFQVLLAEQRVEETRGTRERRLSALLPRAQADVTSNAQTRSLRALGISFPAVPGIVFPGEVVGPFATYDFRASFEQPVLDLRVWRRWKAGEKAEEATRLTLDDARALIARQTAALYLEAQAAESRVRDTTSRVSVAEALLRLAREQREAGVATGVDVLRAEVQLSTTRQRRLEAENASSRALLDLARAIGADLGTRIELAEPLEMLAPEVPEIRAALERALARRADYAALAAQREQLARERNAVRGRYLPRFTVNGNIGGIGRTLGEVRATGLIQGTLSMPIYDRDRSGEAAEFEARIAALDLQMADLRRGIEQEIRQSLLQLDSAAAEVRVAQQARGLAERELELARERFAAGVTTNLEITSAQDSLERAQENVLTALVRHADARYSLERALGRMGAAN